MFTLLTLFANLSRVPPIQEITRTYHTRNLSYPFLNLSSSYPLNRRNTKDTKDTKKNSILSKKSSKKSSLTAFSRKSSTFFPSKAFPRFPPTKAFFRFPPTIPLKKKRKAQKNNTQEKGYEKREIPRLRIVENQKTTKKTFKEEIGDGEKLNKKNQKKRDTTNTRDTRDTRNTRDTKGTRDIRDTNEEKLNSYGLLKKKKKEENKKNRKEEKKLNKKEYEGLFVSFKKKKSFFLKEGYQGHEWEHSLQNYQRSNQDTCCFQRPTVFERDWVQKGDFLADCSASVSGDLSVGKNILVAYMPWEGYNFEDAILISERLVYDDVYTSVHIERYECEVRETEFGIEEITSDRSEVGYSNEFNFDQTDERGIIKIGSFVREKEALVLKVSPLPGGKARLSPHEKLLYHIFNKAVPTKKDSSLCLPKEVEGTVISVQIMETQTGTKLQGPGCVHVYIAQKRKVQVGDKISGRHGNKGIVSRILPRQDMPYLPNGNKIDMVLNPLGVPSRMNVGQVFEALLGLAGLYLNQYFKVPSFDETYGKEASRSLVFSKLYQASLKSGQKWLFDPNFPGKTKVFDGRTGQSFDQLVTVGQSYMLKLVHLVDDKIHARATGPYSRITQQPLKGRSNQGGQRLGEMEVWALEGFGAAYILQEFLTTKSDHMEGRFHIVTAILTKKPRFLKEEELIKKRGGTPEAFGVLMKELQSLCLNIKVKKV